MHKFGAAAKVSLVGLADDDTAVGIGELPIYFEPRHERWRHADVQLRFV